MDSELFGKFLKESKRRLNDKSDSEKVRIFIDWCVKNNYEEVILRISSERREDGQGITIWTLLQTGS